MQNTDWWLPKAEGWMERVNEVIRNKFGVVVCSKVAAVHIVRLPIWRPRANLRSFHHGAGMRGNVYIWTRLIMLTISEIAKYLIYLVQSWKGFKILKSSIYRMASSKAILSLQGPVAVHPGEEKMLPSTRTQVQSHSPLLHHGEWAGLSSPIGWLTYLLFK